MSTRHAEVAAQLREFALSLPGAYEENPWGGSVARVKKGIFVYFGRSDDEKAQASDKKKAHIGQPGEFSINVKLPASGRKAIASGLGRPSDYGLGAKGWVIVTVPAGRAVDAAKMRSLIEESYRAVAPPTLVAQFDDASKPAAPKAKSAPVPNRAKR